MKLLDKLFRRNNPKKIANEIAEIYVEKKEQGDPNPVDSAVKRIKEIIMENPEPQKVMAVLQELIEKEEIPDRVVEKTSTMISENDKIPDAVITQAVNNSDVNVPDKVLNNILEEGDININERLNLMRNINDRKTLEKNINNELKILYKYCKDKRENYIVDLVQTLQEIWGDDINTETQNLINKLVAKKMAENYYDDHIKGTKIYTLSKLMPTEDMIEEDLPLMVEQEFQMLEKNGEDKPKRFSKRDLKSQIMAQLAKEIAYNYKKTKVFVIPQLKEFKNLDKSEEKNFLRAIQVYSNKNLSDKEKLDLHEQIRGNSNKVQVKENQIISKIKKIPKLEKVKTIDCLIEILDDNENIKTLNMINENKVINNLNKIPEEKRKNLIKQIGTKLQEKESDKEKNNVEIKTKENNEDTEMGDR